MFSLVMPGPSFGAAFGIERLFMQIRTRKISEIKPYANNPRKNDHAVDAVAASIREFGFKVPLVVDEGNTIVCGHTRYKAAQKLGLMELPCVIADDLTPEQIKAFRLADNKTAELADWDFELLDLELDDIELDMGEFGFDLDDDWFSREEKDGKAREEGNDEYNEFLEKFEPKKTTDDCYTPEKVYEAVAGWVEKEYGVKRADFVRPFYPGGDYQAFRYKDSAIVVDNPPFSILSEIVSFYAEKGIKFFLFAPTLTLFSSSSSAISAICTGATVVYENGAVVNTSFLTNMEVDRVRSAPELYNAITAAVDEIRAETRVELPKYIYPDYVITAPKVAQYSRYGIDFRVPADESERIRALDAQLATGKAIYGAGYLVSERVKQEREKAERWELSEREKAIVRALSEERR